MIFIRTISGEPPCPRCGTELESISGSGRLGCPECYRHFEARLTPYLKRIYGAAVHKGDIPGSAGAALRRERHIRGLQESLQAAIAEQDFERCAKLRDEIKALEEEARTESAGHGFGGRKGEVL